MTEENTQNLPAVPIKNGQLAPTDLEGLWRLCCILSDSGMVPSNFRGKPNDIFVAVSWGMEIGLSANQSLQGIAVIDGKPGLYGDVGLALVRGSGKLEDIHEYFEGEFGHDDYKAVCEVKRAGEERVHRSEFTIEDAKLMGKWMKPTSNGNPSVWMKYPKRMLKWRARWYALRDVFGDILKGLGIIEEMIDAIDMEETQPGVYDRSSESSTNVETPAETETPKDGEVVDAEFAPEPTEEDYVNPGNADEAHSVNKKDQACQALGIVDETYFVQFCERAAEMNGCPVEEIYQDAINDPVTMNQVFEKWFNKNVGTVKDTPQVKSEPETQEETPQEEIDPRDRIHQAAKNHYGETSEDTHKLIDTYVDYVEEMNGMTDAQIFADLMVSPGQWFEYFENWYETEQARVAEVKDSAQQIEDAPKTEEEDSKISPEEMQSNLMTNEAPSDDQEPKEDNFPGWTAWKQKWNTMRPEYFGDYVTNNLTLFKKAEEEAIAIAKRARKKWGDFYPEVPYPVDGENKAGIEKIEEESKAAQEKASQKTGGTGPAANLERRWNYVKNSYPDQLKEAADKRRMTLAALTDGAKKQLIQDVIDMVGI